MVLYLYRNNKPNQSKKEEVLNNPAIKSHKTSSRPIPKRSTQGRFAATRLIPKSYQKSYQKTYQPTTRYITVPNCDNKTIPVTVVGKGEPLVLIHAYGMDAREFMPFVLPLASKYQVYLPHMRGFGLAVNTHLTQFDFLEQYADDVNAVIEQICYRRDRESIPVAAISMGAQIMWSYFTRYGSDRVSRYLNIDQTPTTHNQGDWYGGIFGKRQPEVFEVFQELLDASAAFEHVDDFTTLPQEYKRKTTDTERMFSLLSAGRPRSHAFIKIKTRQPEKKLAAYNSPIWKHKIRCLKAYVELPYDFRDTAEKITIPVVNLIGGRSQLYDLEHQQKTTKMIPNATEILLPKSGHAVPLDEPLKFYKILRDFMGG